MVRQPFGGLTRWLHTPLPAPPQRWRRGPWRDGAFPSGTRSPRLSTQLGIALAATFTICFLTGVLSHFIQHPTGWFGWPSRPVQLYRITQGVHVAAGLATIPLLGAKLWSVYPRLFTWPLARDPPHAIERLSVAALVAAALFELVTGVLNIALWYAPMPFYFPAAHYWTAWLAVGAIITHVGIKLPVIRAALSPPVPEPAVGYAQRPAARGGFSRRQLLGAVATAAGAVTVTTVGQTVAPLSSVAVFAPRLPGTGPQGLPVNRSAAAAGVLSAVHDPAYRLHVAGPFDVLRLSLTDLAALPQHTVKLPITCVEGWSADGVWTGVRLRDLAALLDAPPGRASAVVESLEAAGRYRSSPVAPAVVADPLTLLALRLNGEPLHPDHGFPCRLVAPNRPGVLQTKWIGRITIGAA